ncbi:MAG: rhodanese-like domain-containing protein [Eggerthellaceae bacterium]|nr:rhodanese-like domain-containing protein [Eggerthellaceae bacterium]
MISAQEAKQMMDAGGSYIILDVRTVAEYQAQHIEGAVVIPVDEIKNRAASELPDKDMTILVYCRSGARAATASQALANMGYTHVYDFGGIMSWPYGTVSGS